MGGYTDGGGVRERTLLCPIQEEDTESTASAGSSVTGIANNTNKRSTVINNNNSVNQPTTSDTQDTHEDIQEEVHDGHYFIKILENEIFHIEEQILISKKTLVMKPLISRMRSMKNSWQLLAKPNSSWPRNWHSLEAFVKRILTLK